MLPRHAQLLASGRDIIQEATKGIQIARSFQRYPTPEPPDPARFASLLPALLSGGVVVFTRLFIDPVWSAVYPELDLPGAEDLENMKNHRDRILDIIGARLRVIEMEAALFCPLVYAASLEARDRKSRTRVSELYEGIAAKGVVVSRTYLSDIRLAWEMIPVTDDERDLAVSKV
jgi:hypothetical protein